MSVLGYPFSFPYFFHLLDEGPQALNFCGETTKLDMVLKWFLQFWHVGDVGDRDNLPIGS